MNKLAIITGFLGATKNRYISYQEDRPFAEKLKMAARVEHIAGLELCYPQDFADPAETRRLVADHGLGISAVNFRSRRTGHWLRGSFTSHSAEERRDVVDDLKRAMDMAEELGTDRVSTCPLNEGHDYIFEMDYREAYASFEETIAEAAQHNRRVRICLEYKWNDPRARCMLGNAGEALAFCQSIAQPNVGVTLDFGHAIQAGERPAQSAVMLARANRLFYVHLNDNDKFWDWDMIPGAYNLWDFLEFLYYLKKLGYDDWFAYDVFPKEIDTVRNFNAVTNATRKLFEITARLDDAKIAELLALRDPAVTSQYLFSIL